MPGILAPTRTWRHPELDVRPPAPMHPPSFRLDYPGENTPGGNDTFIGYSLGTGADSVDSVGVNVDAVPSTSVLYTPKPVVAGGALPAGTATLTLPAGSSLVSADPGCAVSKAPGPFSPGLASCPVPGLAAGQQVAHQITFAMPADAPDRGEVRPISASLGTTPPVDSP